MDDRQIMENILIGVKSECGLLMNGAVESSTPDVHSAFTKAFNETLAMQNEIYAKMAERGWYPKTQAEQKQVDSVKQKFSGQMK